jgi:ATP synthase protein I
MEEKDKEFWRSLYSLATVGLNIVAATFIGLGIGWVIDHKLFHGRTEPWFTLIFLLLGIVAGFRNVFQIIRERGDAGDKKDEDDKPEE